MSEYSDNIRQIQSAAPQAAVGYIDSNPDDAARALELEKSTGTPATSIYGDIEGFEQQHKAALAGHIVANNPYLQDYINKHPLAAPLSSDDYGNLDEASKAMEALPFHRKFAASIHNAIQQSIGLTAEGIGYLAGIEGTKGATERFVESSREKFGEDALAFEKYQQTISGMVGSGIGSIVALAPSLVGGIAPAALQMGLMSGASQQIRAAKLGASEEDQASMFTGGFVVGTAAGAIPLHMLLGGTKPAVEGFVNAATSKLLTATKMGGLFTALGEAQHALEEQLAKKVDPNAGYHPDTNRMAASWILGSALGLTVQRAKPWVDAGEPIPRGVDPLIDASKEHQNKADLDALDESLKAAVATGTRERSPEMYANYVRQHLGEGKIGISGERIAELYGDKVPHAEDNLLGWVPGIKEQLEAARETGQDIQIPIADWLAKVDPALNRELHDDIRVRPGNITKAEVDLEKKHEGNVTLKQEKANRYNVHDEEGNVLVSADIYPVTIEGKKYAQIDDINTPALEGVKTQAEHDKVVAKSRGILGTSQMRDVMRQYLKMNPDIEGFTGNRVSGARNKGIMSADNIKNVKVPVGRHVDSPLAQVRGASALEPAFSIGDRKLELKRFGQEVKGFENFHDFQMIDERGRPVGVVNLSTQGKQLYIESIEGINGLGPRDFGPSLMRDLLRQLKAEFPEAETITGHRVSGARDKAGSFDRPSAQPVVKLSVDDWLEALPAFRQILKGGEWNIIPHTGVDAYFKPIEARPEVQRKLIGAVNDVAKRVMGEGVDIHAVEAIQYKDIDPNAVFMPAHDAMPLILYTLGSRTSPFELIRHEAIHYLRQYNMITSSEWNVLKKAVQDEGWIEKHNINERYSDVGPELKHEEAIAEAFQAWASQRENAFAKAKSALGMQSPIERIFQKVKDFFDSLRSRIAEIVGKKDVTWEDLFEKIEIGEVGKRQRGELRETDMLMSKDDISDMLRANATGLDLVSFKRLQKLIEARHEEDYAAAMKRAEREQRVRQSDEWKAKSAEIRPQVVDDIRARPDIAADSFIRDGELFGKKLDKPVRLRADDLTPEQVAALPKSYVAKSGAPIDEVANLFGFRTGEEMVQRLAQLNAEREASGKNPDMYRRQLIDDEVTRRMEKEHGFLEKNILEEARDQALSQTQLDLLAEEYHAAGMMAKVATIDKNVAQAWAKDAFRKLTVGDVSSDHFMAQIGKYGREAERALIANKPAEAVQFMQKKFLNALMAKQAKELETQIARFDRDAKRLSAREIANMEPEYLNFIHQILGQVGKPVKRSVQDLAEAIDASGHKNLEEFVAAKSGMLRELPVPEFLFDSKFRKPTESLTVDEFRAVQDAVKALAFNGRDELKIYKAGEAADFNEKKSEMLGQLEQFAVKHYDAKGKRWMGPIPPGPAKIIRTYLAAHMQLENVMARWDKFDPRGVWSQYVMRDLVEGANQEAAWGKEYARQFAAMDDGVNVRQKIDNQLFRDPLGGELLNLNRGNLRSIILNAGNESNLTKLAKGYKLEPQQVLDWIHQHATKEDWAWAQKVWDMFGDIKGRSDTMYRSLTGGVAPEAIDIRPIQTPHGEVKGGYYPIIFHPEFEGKSKNLLGKDPLEQENYIRATTPAGYTKERTGYTAPLALDLDMLPGQIRSMLHDIALRPAVINASKVMYDQQIRAEIAKRYGTEYRDLLIPYIRDVANSANYVAKDQRLMAQASEFIRQNMISTLVGFNVGTVMKHGPTALVQSMHEVGSINFLREATQSIPQEFLRWTKSIFSINDTTGENNWQFAKRNSQELQRRDRNYRETLSGAIEEFAPTGQFMSLRQTVLSYASKPVALSDMISAVPTWLAKYHEVMNETGVHGDAIFEADRAVRRAHGSTAITNRPSVMRGGTLVQWFASVYGFFNHIMNRQAELVWRAGDTLKMVKEGEYAAAMGEVPRLSAMLFAYVLAPALIEEMVTPLASKEGESWGKKAAKGIGFTLGASWVGIRDISSALLNDRDPSAGLISTAFKQALNIKRDFAKDQPLSKEHAGKLIQDASGMIGTMTGLTPQPVGRAARFGFNVAQGIERPKGPWGWAVGLRYGTLDKHSTTFSDWTKHH